MRHMLHCEACTVLCSKHMHVYYKAYIVRHMLNCVAL